MSKDEGINALLSENSTFLQMQIHLLLIISWLVWLSVGGRL